MSRSLITLRRHLQALSVAFRLSVANDYSYVVVHGVRLPPGFDRSEIDLLIEIPDDYPSSPPGVGKRIYVPKNLRFQGRQLEDVHEYSDPGWGSWAWFCFQYIDWDPQTDSLITLVELIRADLTDPKTR
jgi:hypothetical protein